MQVMAQVKPCQNYLVTLIRLMVVELVVVMMIKRRSVDLSGSTLLRYISRWSSGQLIPCRWPSRPMGTTHRRG